MTNAIPNHVLTLHTTFFKTTSEKNAAGDTCLVPKKRAPPAVLTLLILLTDTTHITDITDITDITHTTDIAH